MYTNKSQACVKADLKLLEILIDVSGFSAANALPTETETPEFTKQNLTQSQSPQDKNPCPCRKLKTCRTPDTKGVTVFSIYEDEHKNNYIQDKQVEKSTFRRGYKSRLLYVSAV
jgi:hypothetical protein